MSAESIAKGVREGWLVPDAEGDGWHRFAWDFDPMPGGGYRKVPARAVKRVRVLEAR